MACSSASRSRRRARILWSRRSASWLPSGDNEVIRSPLISPGVFFPSPRNNGVTMRKIIVGAQVSLDGVMQAPGGPSEDPTKGFKFGGWAVAYFGQEFREEVDRLFNEKFDL